MQDKDSVAIVESMSPCVGRWYIAEIDYPRAKSADEIEREVLRHGQTDTEVFASVIMVLFTWSGRRLKYSAEWHLAKGSLALAQHRAIEITLFFDAGAVS